MFNFSKIEKIVIFAGTVIALMLTGWILFAFAKTRGPVQLEFDIVQNEQMILFSEFGEPPQFAIWLEDVETGSLQTVFVTYRTAANDWVGKTDCPDSLPLWDSLFKEGTSPYKPEAFAKSSFHAVTGATPKEAHFTIRAEVEPHSEWICWIEVNLAGDFNEEYRYFDERAGVIDTHHTGQPGLVYRAEVIADVGKHFNPQLHGMAVYSSNPDEILPPIKGITTAKDIFEDITIRVIQPKKTRDEN